MKESLNISFASDWENIKGIFKNIIKGDPNKGSVESGVKKALKIIGLKSNGFKGIQKRGGGYEVSLDYTYALLSPPEKKRFNSIIKTELEKQRF